MVNFHFLKSTAILTPFFEIVNSGWINVASSQKVFWLWSHCQQKVPKNSPEQTIWISRPSKKKKLIQNFCSGEWFSTFYWQWDQCQNTFNKIVNPEHDIRTKALAPYSLTQPQRRKRILQDEYKTFRNRNQTNTAARTVGKRCAP